MSLGMPRVTWRMRSRASLVTRSGGAPAATYERLLDVGDDLSAWARAQAKLGGQHAIEVERLDGAVAQVHDAMFAALQGAAQVAYGGALADAGLAGDDIDAGVGGEPGEGASEALMVRVALEEALADGRRAGAVRCAGRSVRASS